MNLFLKKFIGMTRSLEAGHLEPLKVETYPFGKTLLHCNADKNSRNYLRKPSLSISAR